MKLYFFVACALTTLVILTWTPKHTTPHIYTHTQRLKRDIKTFNKGHTYTIGGVAWTWGQHNTCTQQCDTHTWSWRRWELPTQGPHCACRAWTLRVTPHNATLTPPNPHNAPIHTRYNIVFKDNSRTAYTHTRAVPLKHTTQEHRHPVFAIAYQNGTFIHVQWNKTHAWTQYHTVRIEHAVALNTNGPVAALVLKHPT